MMNNNGESIQREEGHKYFPLFVFKLKFTTMNIYEISQLIESTLKQEKGPNTITFVKESELNINKVTIYPLINIDHLRYTPGSAINTFEMGIKILQQRDSMPKMNPDNKRFGDNKIDNWNETSLIANRLIKDLSRNTNIEIDSSDISFISLAYTSLLDGVEFILRVEVDNDTDC